MYVVFYQILLKIKERFFLQKCPDSTGRFDMLRSTNALFVVLLL